MENTQSLDESSADEDDRCKKKFKDMSYEDEMHNQQYATDARENEQKFEFKDHQNQSCTLYEGEETVDFKNVNNFSNCKRRNYRGLKDKIQSRGSFRYYRTRSFSSSNTKKCKAPKKSPENFQSFDSFKKSSENSCLNSDITAELGRNVKHDPNPFNTEGGMESLHEKIDDNISFKPKENVESKVSKYLKLKEEFNTVKQSLKPVDVIMHYRHQIQKISDDYTAQNLKKINLISSSMTEKNYISIYKLHHTNLVLQQQQFENYISGKKNECSAIHGNDIDEIIIRAEKIKKEIENECNLFQKTLPGYAYKENILSALEAHEVTIIPSDYSYFFNIVLPLVFSNTLLKHSTILCESSKLTCDWVKCEIKNIMKHSSVSEMVQILTENNMLNHLKNISSENNLCIIYNLPLKRTVTSDLLLSIFRDLCIKKQCKLILLLSIFNSGKKFQDYFADLKVFTLKVPKLILPVKTVWKREPISLSSDYKEDVVLTALAIHVLNEVDSGDICAFLPCLVDSKSAMGMFMSRILNLNYNNIQCILLLESSCYASEIIQCKNGKRRIYFATSCTEIMPLPSVRFVIDSGLTRNFIFDSVKNLDVLTTIFNSRAKSKLIKSLVGVYSVGICYRIYSKENFITDMSSNELPDILTLNPFNTLITVFHHQPEKAMTVPFVEPLSDSVRNKTIKLLKNFDVVESDKLTEVGKNIVRLPYPARYSKLILQSIEWGFAYEAVILVAFFSSDLLIFKCVQNENDQKIVDAVKLEFIQYESDALTFLNIYKCWAKNKSSRDWCEKHHIEYDALCKVKVKIADICSVVEECLNENIPQKFSATKDFASHVLEMLFHCFADNLCVYSGHDRCGYRILSSRQTAFLPPSSVLSCQEIAPQFVIFNKIVHTSKNFLHGITAIPEEMVYSGLTDKSINYEYSDLFERSLVCGVIEPVSEKLIQEILLEKNAKILQEIEDSTRQKLNCNFIIVDPSVEKGCINIYAPKSVLKPAIERAEEILKNNLDNIINTDPMYELELKRGCLTVPIEVKCVHGAVISSVKIKKNSSKLPSNPQSQENGINVRKNHSSLQYSINLTWIRRPCNGTCYVDFTPECFVEAHKLVNQKFLVLDTKVCVKVSKRGENELMLCNVPCEARSNDIEFSLQKKLPGVAINRIELIRRKPFETTVKDIEDIKLQIMEYCDAITDLLDSEIIVPKPVNSAPIMTACINVFGSEDLTSASEILSNRMIRNFKLTAIPEYRFEIKLSFKVYKVLETSIENQINKIKSDLSKANSGKNSFSFERDFPSEDLVVIKIFSNDITILKRLQKILHKFLDGEVITKNLVEDIDKLFCQGGHLWLRTLEESKQVYIMEDFNSKVIRVYGSQNNCFSVKQTISQFLEDTRNEASETVVLSSVNNNKNLLKSILKEYGADMKMFVEMCQLRSAVLDIKFGQLHLHGKRENVDQAKDILKMLSERSDSTDEHSFLPNGEKCPVCACPAFDLAFRLQHCGHLYCHECILGLVEQAQFPIQCLAENCSEDIVLDDIARILGEEKMKKLLRSSLNDYLQKNQLEILYCPIPDCCMFAFKSEVSEKWICPLCQNEICTKCNVLYHMGFTCGAYQCSKQDPDHSAKVQKTGTNEFKECTKCKSSIERMEGCDHMTCLSCKAHFCWTCVREFPSERAVYNHIPFCKGCLK